MESATPPQPEQPPQPSDLRAELLQDLSTRFASELSSKDSLPIAAQEALVELLDSDAPTAAEIVAAASKSDPLKEEVSHE
jgi:hypothetical protein